MDIVTYILFCIAGGLFLGIVGSKLRVNPWFTSTIVFCVSVGLARFFGIN